jgi:predicted nuclease of predicted toxin-antitoxin system
VGTSTRFRPRHQRDLDFSAILAAGAVHGPSVVQLRTQDLLSEGAARIVARALEAHREDIERGALLSIDDGGTRVRMLPLGGSQGPS